MSLADDLYERDFYAWALEQAELLRGRGAGGNAFDYDNLAEEIEGLARSDLRSCESLLQQIVKHFLKISLADESQLRDVTHWRQEVAEFRLQIEPILTPTLRLRLEERAATVIDRQIGTWREIDRPAAAAWRLAPPTLEQCLDEDWFPEPGARALQPAEPA